VALYALGRSDLMDAVTSEVAAALDRWKVIRAGHSILDIGCGSGRFLERLAPMASLAVGIDISIEMLRRAQSRCRFMPSASLIATTGRDLAAFANHCFDVALAIDSFPYIVAAGRDLVEALARDIARVLRPNGLFLVMNYSYRDDSGADDRDVAELAAAHGFDVVRHGTRDFGMWDARTYLLRLH
jgi:ubiquinone/menaquinone biosynthesis C-methylase UbiE